MSTNMFSVLKCVFLFIYSQHTSTLRLREFGVISLGDGTQNNPFQSKIDYNFMLKNPAIQTPQFEVSQPSSFPQVVGLNVATVLDETLMMHYTSAPPLGTAFPTPGTVSYVNTTENNVVAVTAPIVSTAVSMETAQSTTVTESNVSETDELNDNASLSSTVAASARGSFSASDSMIASMTDAPVTSSPVSSAIDTKITTNLTSFLTYLNTSFNSPFIGFLTPPEIRIYVNINQMPPISVNVADVAATTEATINVDFFEGNNTAVVRSDYVESTRETLSGTTNIDLSNQNLGFGTTAFLPLQTTSSTVSTTTVNGGSLNRIYESKCRQYYDTGTRRVRAAQVHVHIIGGTYSAQKEFPHMAALGYGRKTSAQWLCGGSLISEEYVLTAAHCLSTKTLGDIQFVRLGTTTLQTETLDSQDYDVVARIPYPTYTPGKQYNDIALLKLDRPVSFSDYIAPICLTDAVDLAPVDLVATGWGKRESGSLSSDLQKVELRYVSRDVCQTGYEGISVEELPDGIREESQLCAGSERGAQDTCQGDSGGPLQMQQDGRMYLVGITSFGIGCGRVETPGVYTRVSYFIPWIESIVWQQ